MAEAAAVAEQAIRKAKGRKDGDGQEAVITLDPLRERMDELKTLWHGARSAQIEYSDAIKATAEACGLNAPAVRMFVDAHCSNKVAQRRRNVQQLSLLFEGAE